MQSTVPRRYSILAIGDNFFLLFGGFGAEQRSTEETHSASQQMKRAGGGGAWGRKNLRRVSEGGEEDRGEGI